MRILLGSVWQTSDPKEILRNVESHYIGESKLLMRFLPSPALPISPALPTPTERAGNEFHNGLLGDKNGILLDDSQFSTSPEQHVRHFYHLSWLATFEVELKCIKISSLFIVHDIILNWNVLLRFIFDCIWVTFWSLFFGMYRTC